ncbi:MAG: glycosyltransferase family 2 protein [Hyphomonas sp.]|nr:glycosyltransferase family 2 protein [Hyphomonas sp.]
MTEPSRPDRILVFIPAFRCAAQIERVIAQFDARSQACVDEIIVIDNRSPDDTAEKAEAALAGLNVPARVLRNVDNYNLGGSQKVAFDYAIRNGFDYAIILHGDDQADFRDIVPLLEAGAHREWDAMLGSRFMRGARLQGYSPLRTLGNRVFNLFFSIATGKWITDLGSGLNLYRVEALSSRFYLRYADALTFNYFMVLAHMAMRWRVKFFPISWREEDQSSNVRLVRQTLRLSSILGLYIFRRRTFMTGEHRDTPRTDYPSDIIYENAAAKAQEAIA